MSILVLERVSCNPFHSDIFHSLVRGFSPDLGVFHVKYRVPNVATDEKHVGCRLETIPYSSSEHPAIVKALQQKIGQNHLYGSGK